MAAIDNPVRTLKDSESNNPTSSSSAVSRQTENFSLVRNIVIKSLYLFNQSCFFLKLIRKRGAYKEKNGFLSLNYNFRKNYNIGAI